MTIIQYSFSKNNKSTEEKRFKKYYYYYQVLLINKWSHSIITGILSFSDAERTDKIERKMCDGGWWCSARLLLFSIDLILLLIFFFIQVPGEIEFLGEPFSIVTAICCIPRRCAGYSLLSPIVGVVRWSRSRAKWHMSKTRILQQ